MIESEEHSVSAGSEHNAGEKHDVEKIEVECAVPAPYGNTLTTLDGSEVQMTWKTWLVIFVRS